MHASPHFSSIVFDVLFLARCIASNSLKAIVPKYRFQIDRFALREVPGAVRVASLRESWPLRNRVNVGWESGIYCKIFRACRIKILLRSIVRFLFRGINSIASGFRVHIQSRASNFLEKHIFQYLYFYYSIFIFLLFNTYNSIFLLFLKYIYTFVTLFYSVLVIAFAFSSLGLAVWIKRITPFCRVLSEERSD